MIRQHRTMADETPNDQTGDTSGDAAAQGYQLPWYCDQERFPEDPDMWGGYTAQDYTLAYALDLEHNRQADELVAAAVAERDPQLADRVRFDSERGCFFAYTDTEDEMRRLVAVVAALVAERNPAAIPGDITTSPAFIRRWDPEQFDT